MLPSDFTANDFDQICSAFSVFRLDNSPPDGIFRALILNRFQRNNPDLARKLARLDDAQIRFLREQVSERRRLEEWVKV